MNVRAVASVLAAVAVLPLLLAGTAYACNDPELDLVDREAKAGDTVHFSIINTKPGAEYTIEIVGHGQIASGTDTTDAEGVSGSFTMPDLGDSAKTVSVKMVASHFGAHGGEYKSEGPWPNEESMTYAVPAPPASEPAPAEPAPAATSTDAPAPATEAPATVHRTPAQQRGPTAGTPAAPRGIPAGDRSGRRTSARAHGETTTRRIERTAAAAVALPRSLAAPQPVTADRVQQPSAARSRAAEARAGAIVMPRRVERVPAMPTVAPAVQTDDSEGVRGALLAALALALLVSLCGPDLIRTLSRRPHMESAAVEAELQELIAEERARHARQTQLL